MQEEQLFLGDPVVIGFTATYSAGKGWTLIGRSVREFQNWSDAGFDEYSGLTSSELHDLVCTILGELLIL